MHIGFSLLLARTKKPAAGETKKDVAVLTKCQPREIGKSFLTAHLYKHKEEKVKKKEANNIFYK